MILLQRKEVMEEDYVTPLVEIVVASLFAIAGSIVVAYGLSKYVDWKLSKMPDLKK
jgi:hypothetical protein